MYYLADVIKSAIRITTKPLSKNLRNIFQTIDKLPNCVELNCSDNLLTQLPELPNCEKLDCSDNLLEKLPDLPEITYLRCINNPVCKEIEDNCINSPGEQICEALKAQM